LKLTEKQTNSSKTNRIIRFAYTGPVILFEFWLIWDVWLGGCALAMITRPVVWLPLVSPPVWFVVATRYGPCWPFRRDSV